MSLGNLSAAVGSPRAAHINPGARVSTVSIGPGRLCWVIDDVLAQPDRWVQWALGQEFLPTADNAFPGKLCGVPPALWQALESFFIEHVRNAMGGRRLIEGYGRMSLVTLPEASLRPCQWLCHRDRVAPAAGDLLFAASVLYLFSDVRLGGTSFYEPRKSPVETEQLLRDAQQLSNADFSARYGVKQAYLSGSNEYFEQVGHVPAAWNRLIVYDGGQFHSGQIDHPELLSDSPAHGRLSLNGFFACRRNAR